ncbi:MAG: hypothetical protein MHM6MM_000688 [Cercozoa sp. M6MM]
MLRRFGTLLLGLAAAGVSVQGYTLSGTVESAEFPEDATLVLTNGATLSPDETTLTPVKDDPASLEFSLTVEQDAQYHVQVLEPPINMHCTVHGADRVGTATKDVTGLTVRCEPANAPDLACPPNDLASVLHLEPNGCLELPNTEAESELNNYYWIPQKSFTIESQVRVPADADLADEPVLFDADAAVSTVLSFRNGYAMYLNAQAHLCLYLANIDGDITMCTDKGGKNNDGRIARDEWTHVAVTATHDSHNNDWSIGLYLQGSAARGDMDRARAGGVLATIGSMADHHVHVGCYSRHLSGGNNRHFTGDLSEVRLWSVVRTQQQIAEKKDVSFIRNVDHGDLSGLELLLPMNHDVRDHRPEGQANGKMPRNGELEAPIHGVAELRECSGGDDGQTPGDDLTDVVVHFEVVPPSNGKNELALGDFLHIRYDVTKKGEPFVLPYVRFLLVNADVVPGSANEEVDMFHGALHSAKGDFYWTLSADKVTPTPRDDAAAVGFYVVATEKQKRHPVLGMSSFFRVYAEHKDGTPTGGLPTQVPDGVRETCRKDWTALMTTTAMMTPRSAFWKRNLPNNFDGAKVGAHDFHVEIEPFHEACEEAGGNLAKVVVQSVHKDNTDTTYERVLYECLPRSCRSAHDVTQYRHLLTTTDPFCKAVHAPDDAPHAEDVFSECGYKVNAHAFDETPNTMAVLDLLAGDWHGSLKDFDMRPGGADCKDVDNDVTMKIDASRAAVTLSSPSLGSNEGVVYNAHVVTRRDHTDPHYDGPTVYRARLHFPAIDLNACMTWRIVDGLLVMSAFRGNSCPDYPDTVNKPTDGLFCGLDPDKTDISQFWFEATSVTNVRMAVISGVVEGDAIQSTDYIRISNGVADGEYESLMTLTKQDNSDARFEFPAIPVNTFVHVEIVEVPFGSSCSVVNGDGRPLVGRITQHEPNLKITCVKDMVGILTMCPPLEQLDGIGFPNDGVAEFNGDSCLTAAFSDASKVPHNSFTVTAWVLFREHSEESTPQVILDAAATVGAHASSRAGWYISTVRDKLHLYVAGEEGDVDVMSDKRFSELRKLPQGADEWFHVAATFSYVSQSNQPAQLRLYINGELHGTHEKYIGDIKQLSALSDKRVNLGCLSQRRAGSGDVFQPQRFLQSAALSEVRVYDSARTHEKIRAGMHHSLRYDLMKPTDLAAYWPLDDDYRDHSLHGLHAAAVTQDGGVVSVIKHCLLCDNPDDPDDCRVPDGALTPAPEPRFNATVVFVQPPNIGDDGGDVRAYHVGDVVQVQWETFDTTTADKPRDKDALPVLRIDIIDLDTYEVLPLYQGVNLEDVSVQIPFDWARRYGDRLDVEYPRFQLRVTDGSRTHPQVYGRTAAVRLLSPLNDRPKQVSDKCDAAFGKMRNNADLKTSEEMYFDRTQKKCLADGADELRCSDGVGNYYTECRNGFEMWALSVNAVPKGAGDDAPPKLREMGFCMPAECRSSKSDLRSSSQYIEELNPLCQGTEYDCNYEVLPNKYASPAPNNKDLLNELFGTWKGEYYFAGKHACASMGPYTMRFETAPAVTSTPHLTLDGPSSPVPAHVKVPLSDVHEAEEAHFNHMMLMVPTGGPEGDDVVAFASRYQDVCVTWSIDKTGDDREDRRLAISFNAHEGCPMYPRSHFTKVDVKDPQCGTGQVDEIVFLSTSFTPGKLPSDGDDDDDDDDDKNDGPTGVQQFFIALGVLVGVVALAGMVYFMVTRAKRRAAVVSLDEAPLVAEEDDGMLGAAASGTGYRRLDDEL